MANKISKLLDRIETRLGELVSLNRLASVGRLMLDPDKVSVYPALAIVPGEFHRQEDRSYTCDVLLQLVCKSDALIEQGTIEAVAEIDDCLDGLNDEDGVGGTIERPHWQFWAVLRNGGQFTTVGAWGGLTLRVESPLKV